MFDLQVEGLPKRCPDGGRDSIKADGDRQPDETSRQVLDAQLAGPADGDRAYSARDLQGHPWTFATHIKLSPEALPARSRERSRHSCIVAD